MAGFGCRPRPRGGTLEALRGLVRVAADDDWMQILGWVLAALRPRGPYPVLVLSGEQGACKSSTARILRGLVDPSSAPLRSVPRDERDLMIAALNGHVVALDNISSLSANLSDALCRLATGGGFSTRKLFTDAEEVLVDAQRPIILTGIEQVVARSDLADRSLLVELPVVHDRERKTEAALDAEARRARPLVLGALLDAVACGLRERAKVRPRSLPRMADYAEWIEACEPALGVPRGSMVEAYERARRSANDTTIEASAVGRAVVAWLGTLERKTWEGTASTLLKVLARHLPEKVTLDRNEWPTGPRGLVGALKRVTPALRAVGIIVEVLPRRSDCRLLRVTSVTTSGTTVTTVTTVSDASVHAPEQLCDEDGDDHDGRDGCPSAPQRDVLAVDV